MKVAVAADAHVDNTMGARWSPEHGMFDTWAEAIRQVRHMVDVCNDEQVDVLVLAGDTFHTGRPPAEAVALVCDELGRLETAKVIPVSGNHDQSGVVGAHRTPIDAYMRSQPWCLHVPSGPEVYDALGARLALVPWTRVAGASNLEGAQRKLVEEIDELAQEGADLIFGHLTVAEAMFNNGMRGSETKMMTSALEAGVPTSVLDNGPWKLGRFGHIHRRQEIGSKTGYVGSMYRVDFGEADQPKGFEVIDLSDSGAVSTFHEFDTRKLGVIDLSVEVRPLEDDGSFNKGDVARVVLPHGAVLGSASLKAKASMEKRGISVELRHAPAEAVDQKVAKIQGVSLAETPQAAMRRYIEANVTDPDFRQDAIAHFTSITDGVLG